MGKFQFMKIKKIRGFKFLKIKQGRKPSWNPSTWI